MRTANPSVFKRLTLLVIPVVLVILVLDVDGWGTFLLNVAFTLFVQIAIATMLFGWLVIVVDIVKGALNFTSLSRNVRLGVFLTSVIVALPLIGRVFHRPVDIYDIAQTVLVIAGGLLLEPRIRFLVGPPIDQTPRRDVDGPTAAAVGVAPYANSELYRNLLNKAAGNKEMVGRLIEYERKRKPYASQEELLRDAIERWEQDNR